MKKIKNDHSTIQKKQEQVEDWEKEKQAQLLQEISKELNQHYARLKIESLVSEEAKEELRQVIFDEIKKRKLTSVEELTEHLLQESVGLGVIEEILKDPSITDLSFNGTELILESPQKKWRYPNPITAEYIERLTVKMANSDGKEFTPKDPILDMQFKNLRINAVHSCMSESGMTLSIRVSRETLVLTMDNVTNVAPRAVLFLLFAAVRSQMNVVLSGETGAGKTEWQKLLLSAIPFSERIVMVEDVQETHVKALFPEKDILSWHSGRRKGMSDLIKAGLRNNPKWLMVTEIRYAQEAYEWLQAILSDHNGITTIHAIEAEAIPDRILSIVMEEYHVDEDRFLRLIQRYIHLGIQLKVRKIQGKTIRYLQKVMIFGEEKGTVVFEQKCSAEGRLIPSFYPLPTHFQARLEEFGQQDTILTWEKEIKKYEEKEEKTSLT